MLKIFIYFLSDIKARLNIGNKYILICINFDFTTKKMTVEYSYNDTKL